MPHGVAAFGRWFLLFLSFWIIFSGAQGWAFGAIASLAAAAIAYRLPMRWPALRITQLPACLGFFFTQLLVGGWDVARRALHPNMPIDPAWELYQFTSDNPKVHLLLSALVGLMPGTLSSHFEQGHLHIHTLDQRRNWRTTTEQFERLLDRLLPEVPAP